MLKPLASASHFESTDEPSRNASQRTALLAGTAPTASMCHMVGMGSKKLCAHQRAASSKAMTPAGKTTPSHRCQYAGVRFRSSVLASRSAASRFDSRSLMGDNSLVRSFPSDHKRRGKSGERHHLLWPKLALGRQTAHRIQDFVWICPADRGNRPRAFPLFEEERNLSRSLFKRASYRKAGSHFSGSTLVRKE